MFKFLSVRHDGPSPRGSKLAAQDLPVRIEEVAALHRALTESEACAMLEGLRSKGVGDPARLKAAKTLKECPHRSVVQEVITLLGRGDDYTRELAAIALTGTVYPEARKALIDIVGLKDNAPLRAGNAAALALRPVHDEVEVALLCEILKRCGGAWGGGVANAVCSALTGTTSPAARDVLVDLTLNPHRMLSRPGAAIEAYSVRWGCFAAAKALARTPLPDDILEAVIGRALDQSSDVRWNAIEALSRRPQIQVQTALKQIALSDPEAQNRSAAAAGLLLP